MKITSNATAVNLNQINFAILSHFSSRVVVDFKESENCDLSNLINLPVANLPKLIIGSCGCRQLALRRGKK